MCLCACYLLIGHIDMHIRNIGSVVWPITTIIGVGDVRVFAKFSIIVHVTIWLRTVYVTSYVEKGDSKKYLFIRLKIFVFCGFIESIF